MLVTVVSFLVVVAFFLTVLPLFEVPFVLVAITSTVLEDTNRIFSNDKSNFIASSASS